MLKLKKKNRYSLKMSSRCVMGRNRRKRIKRIRYLSNNKFFAYTKKHIHNGTHTRQQTHARATHWARIHAHAPRHDCCLGVDDGRTDGHGGIHTSRTTHIVHTGSYVRGARMRWHRRAHVAAAAAAARSWLI